MVLLAWHLVVQLPTRYTESQFGDPSSQFSSPSATKQHWLSHFPGTNVWPVTLFCQCIVTWWFFLLPVCWNVHWLLHACYSMLPLLEFRWMADNNAALFHPSWDLLCQIQVWPGIIKLQCCSCISSSVICFFHSFMLYFSCGVHSSHWRYFKLYF
jgi:hypothetical protein